MKNKIFALSLLAAAACMTSCSDSLDTDITSAEQGELTTYKFRTNIILPQEMAGSVTRAENDNHTDGDKKEWYINNDNVFFALYDVDGDPLPNEPVFEFKQQSTDKWPTVDNDKYVTAQADVTIKASAGKTPKYLVVFVNLDNHEYAGLMDLRLENLKSGQTGQTHFRPGGESFYQRPASFRNMMLQHYANLKANDGKGGFFMMNSSWNSNWQQSDNDHYNVREVDITNYIHTKEEFDQLTSAGNDPAHVLVYVERVVAKVNTLFKVPTSQTSADVKGWQVATAADGMPIVKIKQKDGYNKKARSEYFVKFDGWQLNATNKSFKPLKDIGSTPSYFTKVAGNNYQAFRDGRSYWAIDQNYNTTENYYLTNKDFSNGNNGWNYGSKVPDLNYYTLTNMKRLKFGLYPNIADNGTSDEVSISNYTDYCFENTMDGAGLSSDGKKLTNTGAVTHVLIRAQYVVKKNSSDEDANATYVPLGKNNTEGNYGTTKKSDGTYKNANVYRVGKTIFTEEELTEYIYEHLSKIYSQMTEDQKSKISIVLKSRNNYNDHSDVKSKVLVPTLKNIAYTGKNGAPANTGEEGDVTEIVFGEATVYTFERGICYYFVPIKHFIEGHSLQSNTEGLYGVVRNHWYQVEITGVEGFGHPANPGEGPDSNDPDKPYDPENPGGPNPSDDPSNPVPTNPKDPDNPRNPGEPKPIDPNNPTDPTDPTDPNHPHPGNPGKPIIPEDSEDDDFNLNAQIRVLSWAKMKMEAQLGGMQEWK